ncbi:MAG: STAS-like domain-containing protein [Candidatus Peribacteraceae bacterium]|jgi:hypothetical protein|nr:STAS-like domain-containing protein [Candidatus Peribacteraceae bacterium]
MMIIKMRDIVGTFASNKDIAKEIRTQTLIPLLEKEGEELIIDFEGVDGATQSFIHALISEPMRRVGTSKFFEKVTFKTCNEKIQAIIIIVGDYMQAGLE